MNSFDPNFQTLNDFDKLFILQSATVDVLVMLLETRNLANTHFSIVSALTEASFPLGLMTTVAVVATIGRRHSPRKGKITCTCVSLL